MADTVQQLLRERCADSGTAIKHADRTWTWAQHLEEAARQAAALIALTDPARPLHIGTLLGNTPAMLTAMAAAGLGGYVLCGINNTRRGDALARAAERVSLCRRGGEAIEVVGGIQPSFRTAHSSPQLLAKSRATAECREAGSERSATTERPSVRAFQTEPE